MKTRDTHDLVGGALMVGAGAFFAVYGSRYNFGEASRMGPGYFPVVLGWVLAVLGAIVVLQAWLREGTAIEVQWKSLGWSVASILVFAFGLQWLGVLLATFLSAMTALMASEVRMRTRVSVCAVVMVLTYLIFVVGLQMLLPVWPWSN